MRYLVVLVVLWSLACKEKKYHEDKIPVVIQGETDVLTDILKFQHKMNDELKNSANSPLYHRHKKNFIGLDFFAPDTNYRVLAQLKKMPENFVFSMPMTTNTASEYLKYGTAHFTLFGKDYELEIYQDPLLFSDEKFKEHLFLPFMDNTNGTETYSGGRYIDLSIPKGDTILIDFNKSYNPYCAYNTKYACPIVPTVNRLDTEILAGVKDFKQYP